MCLSWRRGTHRRTWSPPPPALAALLQVSEEGVAAEDGAVLPLVTWLGERLCGGKAEATCGPGFA